MSFCTYWESPDLALLCFPSVVFSLTIPGFIGKVTLQIPFYRPHVDPWVISVSKLHLIGSPEIQEDFDEERERLYERESKKAILLALEQKWKVSPLGH